MPHQRNRHLSGLIARHQALWPIVGVTGLRQVGKSTLLREQIGIPQFVTLDDEDTRADAEASGKVFLAKLQLPAVIDEIQKVPKLFDALKSFVDRKKRPGQFYLTGSTAFSSKVGVRESLTGRIGQSQLYPLTLSESRQTELRKLSIEPFHAFKPRFTPEDIAQAMPLGGMPVPMFIREQASRDLYWEGWLETTVIRDVGRVFGRSYDPDLAMSVLRRIGKILREGDLPTLKHFDVDSRKLRKYLEAMETVYLLKRIRCHELGVGKEVWLVADSGLVSYLLGNKPGEGASLSLARHYILNELMANTQYSGKPLALVYFKSSRGSPVDLVWDDIPIKITGSSGGALGWEERALEGAMKKLQATRAILVAPCDRVDLVKKGISVVPWSYWS